MNENKKPISIERIIFLTLIIGLIISNLVQFTKYVQLQDDVLEYENIIKVDSYKDGFLDALQFQIGFLEQSGIVVKGLMQKPINDLVFGSIDDILKNKKSAYAAGSSSGSIYQTEYNPVPEWYSKKEYDNKSEIVYIHDSVMDNDTKWKYYWAGVMVQSGRYDEFQRISLITFLPDTTNLQKSFYYLGRCQVIHFRNNNIEKYNTLYNQSYFLLNQSWDYMNNFNYNGGCD